VATWNIAAINNNPFEYWLTLKEFPLYNKMMQDCENFIENPGEHDVPVSAVFTDAMFNDLEARMTRVGWADLPKVRTFWEQDYSKRSIITQFMKDKSLGAKRLTSMPDRYTNTINTVNPAGVACRPTTINMYDGDLSTLQIWYDAWADFMFDTPLTVASKAGPSTMKVCEMLTPIKQAKYPAITEEEEAISIPLQVLAHAIFDAVQVHMLNTVATPQVWQPIRRSIVTALNLQKVPNTLKIIAEQYVDTDIVCLQEVSASFIDVANADATIASKFHVVSPRDLDGTRDQNSVVMLSKARFPAGAGVEITEVVEGNLDKSVESPVALGDIIAITATDAGGQKYVIVSFHGDTNGLATIPVLAAVHKTMEQYGDHELIFGLDANTYESVGPKKDKQDVGEFGEYFVKLGYSSCWGDVPDRTNYSTFNARTYLQPQLNKACRSSELKACGDVNPKDFILFKKAKWGVQEVKKDNTGTGTYLEDTPFPSLEFPSDHGVLSTVLERAA
jgi:hypothetical protein